MLQNYFITAWRQLTKNRLFSLITILGLAFAMTSAILILLFVRGEMGYDTWIPNHERVVRLHNEFKSTDGSPSLKSVRTPGRWMRPLLEQFGPDAEAGVRVVQFDVTYVDENRAFNETTAFADPSFFDVFDIPLIAGNRDTALSKPFDVILTESMAVKYFGRTEVVGETLQIKLGTFTGEVTVTGVMADLPTNTHMAFDFLAYMVEPMFAAFPNILETWTSINTYTYFKLAPGVSEARAEELVKQWLNTKSPFVQSTKDALGDADALATDLRVTDLMPIPDIYLGAKDAAGNLPDMKVQGNGALVSALAGVAILVLIVAAINFTNLATVRAITRAREVALRKVLGASRGQIALQFLGEAVITAVAAVLVGLMIIELILPTFSQLVDRELSYVVFGDIGFTLSLIGLGVLVGLASGTYPALILSGFMPAKALKANKSTEVEGSASLRQTLVVFQFAVSIGLVVCTGVVYAQTLYTSTLDLGLKPDNRIAVFGLGIQHPRAQKQRVLDEMARIPGVTAAALSSEAPSQDNHNNLYVKRVGSGDVGDDVLLNIHSFGPELLELYDVKPIAGRTFEDNRQTDYLTIIPQEEREATTGQTNVILNRAAALQLGFASPEDAIGAIINGNVFQAGNFDMAVVGVIDDIYFRSIKFEVRPSLYINSSLRQNVINLKVTERDPQSVIKDIERVWAENLPLVPMSYSFVDQMVADMYAEDRSQGLLFGGFAILSVVIACFGLYGLASFTVKRKTKEIGVRKVMGATVTDIVRILVWQFSKPVALANLLALPVAFYLMRDWLMTFTYRLDMLVIPLVGITAGLVALFIAWATVAGRAVSVARTNPIQALRYE